jgi:hypothetical protein
MTTLPQIVSFLFNERNGIGLVRALDCKPLSIAQAAACFVQRVSRVTVSRYLDEVRSDYGLPRLLKIGVGDSQRDGSASNSINR